VRELDDVFRALAGSRFRRSFTLGAKERAYLRERGMPTVIEHARDFVAKRLASAAPAKDGKQTPFRGHPVFVAQHATATCCRGCLEKWHDIPKGQELSEAEREHVAAAIARWLEGEMREGDANPSSGEP
jgi:hypothetical protein